MFKILPLLFLICLCCTGFSQHQSPAFTAVFDAKKNAVQVKWMHGLPNIKTYTLQQSNNNKIWKDIDIQSAAANRTFYYEDKKVTAGENYYRLKYIAVDGKTDFSNNIIVIIPATQSGWIMYPVPVKDFLTLEYRGVESIKGVINVFIQQSSGRIIFRLRNSSLNKTIKIPVHNMGKGVYDVRIIVGGNLVWNQRFIK